MAATTLDAKCPHCGSRLYRLVGNSSMVEFIHQPASLECHLMQQAMEAAGKATMRALSNAKPAPKCNDRNECLKCGAPWPCEYHR